MNIAPNRSIQVDQQATETDVIICGGGPVGLALAYLLGRAGVKTVLFEKRASTTTLPKGQYVHAHTAELYRQWGVWDLLRDKGWRVMRSNGQGVYVNVANGPVAEVRAAYESEEKYAEKWAALSPVYPRKVPAHDYEAALFTQASQWPDLQLHFSRRVVDVSTGRNQVSVQVNCENTGAQTVVRARYLVACDGAHSFIRNRIGGGEDNGPAFLNQVLVEFAADLEDTLGKDGFFHSFVLDPRYNGWFGAQHPDDGLWRYSFRHDEDTIPGDDYLLARIRGALGMPDLPVEIKKTFRFDYTTGLLRSWREGPVFFAGDAAHWHSPWGGFGANSGVPDVNNLAWKLAAVLKSEAGQGLLDTYQTERKSKAYQTVKTATYNSLHYLAIAQAAIIGEPDLHRHGKISKSARQFLKERIKPHGENAVLHTGYQLGTVYQSAAIITDGSEQPDAALVAYRESSVPGVRAPHVWLTGPAAGEQQSLLDHLGGEFVLVISENTDAWQAACDQVGVPCRLLNLSPASPLQADREKFDHVYGEDGHYEAFLIRPDGHIARRFETGSARAAVALLSDTFDRILDRQTI